MRLLVSARFRVFLDWLHFIKVLSKITKPITRSLGKDKKFKWMLACEAGFQELKKRLTSAPAVKETRRALPDSRFGVSHYGSRCKDLEALSYGKEV
jgi:hypothetical protein